MTPTPNSFPLSGNAGRAHTTAGVFCWDDGSSNRQMGYPHFNSHDLEKIFVDVCPIGFICYLPQIDCVISDGFGAGSCLLG